ncbi:hypothetical protein MferCBS31731_002269 [Microsporum ferrugineum]
MGVHLLALAFFALFTAGLAVPPPSVDYEVIIVGGGPSGLSTLSALGRVRRTALLYDDGHYRNGPTRHMHDVIGNDGAVPSAFRALARQQISRYNTTHIKDVKVTKIAKIDTKSGQYPFFTVTGADGSVHTARKIVLGTGLKDVFPSTPGISENFGKGIFWCPWCDGWEHRDQPFGVLGPLGDVMDSVLEMWSLNRDIIAFVNGTEHDEKERKRLADKYPRWEEQLKKYNVKLEDRVIQSIVRLRDGSKVGDKENWKEYDLFRINFTDGKSTERNALITNFPAVQRSDLPDQLGLQRDKANQNKIAVNINGMRTSVSGVYAVGDANNDGSTNVVHAMFSGKRAAVYIHVEIERENSLALIQKREAKFSARKAEKDALRLVGRDLEDVWEKAKAMSK